MMSVRARCNYCIQSDYCSTDQSLWCRVSPPQPSSLCQGLLQLERGAPCDQLPEKPQCRGVEVGGRHEAVQDPSGHGHTTGVGESRVELHVVHIHFGLVKVADIGGEGQVKQYRDPERKP